MKIVFLIFCCFLFFSCDKEEIIIEQVIDTVYVDQSPTYPIQLGVQKSQVIDYYESNGYWYSIYDGDEKMVTTHYFHQLPQFEKVRNIYYYFDSLDCVNKIEFMGNANQER